jgi:hypothetical protein
VWSARATPTINPETRGVEAMTKKHFKAIAEILRAYGASYDMTAQFAHYFQKENPRFDPVKFMNTAGIWDVYQPANLPSLEETERTRKLQDLYR